MELTMPTPSVPSIRQLAHGTRSLGIVPAVLTVRGTEWRPAMAQTPDRKMRDKRRKPFHRVLIGQT
jgi:hypothetical protein